jgi:ribokinase
MKNIIVVGSLNADLVQQVERLPKSGETIAGSDLKIIPGGKGANQACAAARLGGKVEMVGCVGDDAFGPMLTKSLQETGADASKVCISPGATGTAAILVLPSGENTIVISPGANGRLGVTETLNALKMLTSDSILLTQLEVPVETTQAAMKLARERGATTIFDPAPARFLYPEFLKLVSFLTPNQTEAALLLGSRDEIESYEDAEKAARQLLERGPSVVVVKLGSMGAVIADDKGCQQFPSFPVEAVDTTAAGDTWNGAFAVALAESKSLAEAARFANAAGALSVTRQGAQSSIPDRAEVERLLTC